MKNLKKAFCICILMLIGLTIIGCTDPNGNGDDDENNTPKTITYVSYDSDDTRYTLAITEKLNSNRSAYVPKSGDSFVLTVELYNNGNYMISLACSGTVQNSSENTINLNISINNAPLLITIENGLMTVISGTLTSDNGEKNITLDENTKLSSIAAKKIIITNFPGNTYNGKQVEISIFNSLLDIENTFSGTQAPIAVGVIYSVSGNILTLPLKFWNNEINGISSWTGSGSYYLVCVILDDLIFGYTDGQEFIDTNSLLKIDIADAESTVNWNKFKEITIGTNACQHNWRWIESEGIEIKRCSICYETDGTRTVGAIVHSMYHFTNGYWMNRLDGGGVNGSISALSESNFTVTGGGVSIMYSNVYTKGGGAFYDNDFDIIVNWDYLFTDSGKIGIVFQIDGPYGDDDIYFYVFLGKNSYIRQDSGFNIDAIGIDTTDIQSIHNGVALIAVKKN